jgi:hypothetical protein
MEQMMMIEASPHLQEPVSTFVMLRERIHPEAKIDITKAMSGFVIVEYTGPRPSKARVTHSNGRVTNFYLSPNEKAYLPLTYGSGEYIIRVMEEVGNKYIDLSKILVAVMFAGELSIQVINEAIKEHQIANGILPEEGGEDENGGNINV